VNDHTLEIRPHIPSGNPDGHDAVFASPKIAAHIAGGIVSELMCQSVDLDRDSGGFAEKVEHEWAKRMLSSELQSFGPQPKHPPEPDLRRAHAFAKLACLVDGQSENPSTMLRTVPLPGKRRGG
jgi:hypothetical protein